MLFVKKSRLQLLLTAMWIRNHGICRDMTVRLLWQPARLYRVLLSSFLLDGPMKPPYAVYFQGGLTWEHAKLGILMSLQKLVDKNLVTL